MPPSTKPPPLRSADGKWMLYVDKEDSFSPPPQGPQRRKAKSKANIKPSPPPLADGEDSSSPALPEHKYLFYFTHDSTNSPATERLKAKSKAQSKPEKNDNDVDTPQDGRGDPNLSGITLPLPLSLIELQLHEHDTGFYIITAGLEVGITTVKGIANSRLTCQSPSSHVFSTWRQAKSYYDVCFNDGSVSIRSALQESPMQSPARKRQRLIKISERRLPPQPPFAPAFSTPKAKGSASQPINISSTETTPASHSTREYTPLYFPESPTVPSKPGNSRKRPHGVIPHINDNASHARLQAIPRNTDNAASPTSSRQYPEPTIPGVSPLGQYPEQSRASLTPPQPDPSRSLGHIDPHYVFVESSSDEGTMNDNSTPIADTRPRPRQVHRGAPTTPVIIISDSEEDPEEEPERETFWPHHLDIDSIRKLNELFGVPGFGSP